MLGKAVMQRIFGIASSFKDKFDGSIRLPLEKPLCFEQGNDA